MMRVSAALLLSITGASAFGTYPDVPATCFNGIGDNPTFADIYGIDCASWSTDANTNGLTDCALDDVITDASACVDSTDGSTLMGPDGVACEVRPDPRPYPITQCMCTCPRNGPAWVRLCRV